MKRTMLATAAILLAMTAHGAVNAQPDLPPVGMNKRITTIFVACENYFDSVRLVEAVDSGSNQVVQQFMKSEHTCSRIKEGQFFKTLPSTLVGDVMQVETIDGARHWTPTFSIDAQGAAQ